ncbi:hypothetical protein FOCC_FOCC006571 [Frankliniella occidentalis]|nr:hypothetical protein FOCC_FOCC006571 [Frankliniella occidentalis]
MFLLLHCGIYILASPYLLLNWVDQAVEILKTFVQYSAQIFGNHFVLYNVHSLTHSADECRQNGALESFSAFPYENQLKTIKQTLRSGYQPLEQIVKRDSENSRQQEVKLKSVQNTVQLFQPHNDPNQDYENQFRRITVNEVTYKVGDKDSCFMTNTGRVAVLQNIIQRNGNEVLFCGKRFNSYEDVYSYPIDSSLLGIYKVSELSDVTELFMLEDFVVCRFQIPQSDGEEEEEEIEICSRKWLALDDETGDIKFWWPPNVTDSKALQRIVTKHLAPDHTSWRAYTCEVLSGYGDYLSAHIGHKRRMDDSTYETENEPLGAGLRKKRARKLSSDEDCGPAKQTTISKQSKKDAHLPAPPEIIIKPGSSKVTVSADSKSGKNLPTPPGILINPGSSKATVAADKSVNQPLVVVKKSGSSVRQASNKTALKVSRQDRGSKASNMEELKKILEQKKKRKSEKSTEANAKMTLLLSLNESEEDEEEIFKSADQISISEQDHSFQSPCGSPTTPVDNGGAVLLKIENTDLKATEEGVKKWLKDAPWRGPTSKRKQKRSSSNEPTKKA